MRSIATAMVAAGAILLATAGARAQHTGVPEKMPFDIPYGAPITMEMARKAIDAAEAEARKRGWKMAIAVVSPSGDLTDFAKMDDTQHAASTIAPNKARTSARFRRTTQVFFEAMETGHPFVMTLEQGIVASPGGIPIVIGGKLIGGIGCSGGTGPQDAVVCQAGIDAIK